MPGFEPTFLTRPQLAATFNVVPATLFEFRGRHNVIRAQQVATAVLLRAINIVRSDLVAFGR